MICKPELFTGDMIRAILDGRKTMTRRPMKPQPPDWLTDGAEPWNIDGALWGFAPPDLPRACRSENTIVCPHPVGSRIWCRETWAQDSGGQLWFRADGHSKPPDEIMPSGKAVPTNWRPSIHMPRWASRITLEVEAVKVERVAGISSADAMDEGISCVGHRWGKAETGTEHNAPEHAFRALWDSIYAKRPGCSWADSPWVWVYTFKRVEEEK